MGALITLLFTELLFIGIIYFFNNGNLLSPALISYVFFVIATICIIYNIDFWDVSFSFQTYGIISAGLFCMMLPELMILSLKKSNSVIEVIQKNIIYMNSIVNILVNIFSIGLLALQVVRTFQAGNFTRIGLYAIGVVKNNEDSIDSLIKLSARGLQIIGFVYLYIFMNNVIKCKDEVRNNGGSIIPILAYILSMMVYGNRAGLVKLFGIIYVLFVVMKLDRSREKKLYLRKVLFPLLTMGVLVVIGFFALRGVSKVNSTAATRTFSEYITYYVGSPLYLMDKFLQKPSKVHGSNELFGQMSMTSLYTTFGINVNNLNNYTLVGGQSNFAGNEYSWFQRPICDFGIWGMFLFTFIVYWIFNYILYFKVLNKKLRDEKRTGYIVFYAFYFYLFILSFYYCQICFAFSLVNIVILIAIIWGINNLHRVVFVKRGA